VRGGVRALEFYAEVFQATERRRVPGLWETIDHAEIEIGDSILLVQDESPYLGTKAPPPLGLDGCPFFLSLRPRSSPVTPKPNAGKTPTGSRSCCCTTCAFAREGKIEPA
jgi:hypothetical protein